MVILMTFVATLAIYGIASRNFILVSLWVNRTYHTNKEDKCGVFMGLHKFHGGVSFFHGGVNIWDTSGLDVSAVLQPLALLSQAGQWPTSMHFR